MLLRVWKVRLRRNRAKHMPAEMFYKSYLRELRLLNLVNPVNLAILSKSRGLENSQILFWTNGERFIRNECGLALPETVHA